MQKFIQQTKVVFLKNNSINFRRDKLIPILFVPFVCGLLLWISIFDFFYDMVYFQKFYMPLAICGVVRNCMMMIVNEKKNGQRENQLVMGLSRSSYYFGWIFSCFIQTIICATLYFAVVVSFVTIFWQRENLYHYILFYIQYIFYSYAIIGQMLLISSFFMDGRKATDTYGIIFIFINYVYYLLDFENVGKFTQLFLSIFPQNLILYFWDYHVSKNTIQINNFYSMLIFFGQGSLGILLYLYFDQIMSHEFGTAKSICFIFSYFKKKKTQIYENEIDLEFQNQKSLGSELLNIQEEVQDQNETAMVRITQLTKVYNGVAVVNRLNLNLYQNQIFTLLGHNGAGKSSTINMICGLIQKDSGNISINGLDIDKNLNQVRQILGYCSQKDIVYEDLNVHDHLLYYGRLKHISNQELQMEIESILNICQLHQEKLQYGKYLSSGGKRKLSLAIALIGGSKILLLDEPTTGLDPTSKQQIWNILRNIKLNKCIIMTTHQLEEATELSDNIGILLKGKLKAYGTVDQMKKQFSIGYNITIECQDEIHQQQVTSELVPYINNVSNNTIKLSSQGKILKLNIPLRFESIIPQLLENIETIRNITQFFQMTSLEDAYIKIHSEEEPEQVQFQENIDLINSLSGSAFHYSTIKQLKSLILRRIWIAKENKWQYLLYLTFWILLLTTFFCFKDINSGKVIYIYVFIKLIFINLQIYLPIIEKQQHIKHSFLIHGSTIKNYWLSNLIFDIIVIIAEQLVFLVFMIIAATVDYNSEYHDYKIFLYLKSIVVNIIFSVGLNCQSYLATYFSGKSQSVNMQLPLLIIIYQCVVIFFSNFLRSFKFLFYLMTPITWYALGYNIILSYSQDEFLGFVASQLAGLLLSLIQFSILICLESKEFRRKNSQQSNDDAIQVQKLTWQISNRKILSDINLSVPQKKIFGLLGPNGAGKTSLFNIISKQATSTMGQATIMNGRTQLGWVPSFSPLQEDLNLIEHFKIFGLLKGMDMEKIDAFINSYCKIADLKRRSETKVRFLSGGERKKLQIGVSLIGGANILLMDEPMNGVDTMFKQIFYQMMLKNCQINNSSIFFTTHSISEAQRMSDILGILVNGELKFVGTLNQLMETYKNRIQLSFKAKSSDDQVELKELINKYIPISQQELNEYRNKYYSILIDGAQIHLSTLYVFCKSEQVQRRIDDFEIQQATLDQIFKYYVHQQQNFLYLNQIKEERAGRNFLTYCCCQI